MLLTALGLVVVLIVVILVTLVSILVVIAVLRIAALVIIIIVAPRARQSVCVSVKRTACWRTGHRNRVLVRQPGLRVVAGLRIAGSGHNSPGRRGSKVGRWRRRPHRGIHPAEEAGGLTW